MDNKNIKYILVTKRYYDASVTIMVQNFIQLLNDKFRMVFIPERLLSTRSLINIDLVIFCRTFEIQSIELLDLCMASNIPALYAIDDDLLNFYKSEKTLDFGPDTQRYYNLCYLLSNVDLVLSFSKSITKSISVYTDKIYELHTNILSKYFHHSFKDVKGNVFRIAYLGGEKKEEFDLISGDLVEIAQKYKNRVEFHFWGFQPEQSDNLYHYSKVFTKRFTANYEEYLTCLSKSAFDLVLCPLFHNDFKKGKSPIKFLEASVCGACGLFSDVSPYEIVVDGNTGFKVDNVKQAWKRKIKKIIHMNKMKRNQIHENAVFLIKEQYTTEVLAPKFENAIDKACHNQRTNSK